MAINEAHFSVTGYVATQPKMGVLRNNTPTLSFRFGWTPRVVNRETGEWTDQQSSFVSVTCYRKVAENAGRCLRRGDPVVLNGTLRVREWTDRAGTRRNSVEVTAESLGHDLYRGTSLFSKQPQHTEQTAVEYERAQAEAAGRSPLPGDVEAAREQDDQLSAPVPADGIALAEIGDTVPSDISELEPADSADADPADFDDADEREDAEREPEPVGALA